MKRNPLWWVFGLLGLCIGAAATIAATEAWRPSAPAPALPASIVVGVIDGNTVRLLDGRVVRIAYVHAPAMDEAGGQAARHALQSVVLDRRVVLVGAQREGARHWRATVLIDGERDVGQLLLKAGYARHRDHDHQPMPERELYGFMEEEARQHRRGLWRYGPLRVSCGDAPRPETVTIKTVAV